MDPRAFPLMFDQHNPASWILKSFD
jgi:hypothetical protein